MGEVPLPEQAPGKVNNSPAAKSGLWLRSLSAVILAPVVLGAVYVGTPWFELLVIAMALIASSEWANMPRSGNRSGNRAVRDGQNPLSTGASPQAGTGISRGRFFYLFGGVFYIAIPCLGLIWLREIPDSGRDIIFWILAIVWATDIGAYFVGSTFGGPRLAPKISPKKTWSGLFGGIVGAAGVGWLIVAGGMIKGGFGGVEDWSAYALGEGFWPLLLLTGLLAVIEQMGDLFESFVKRRFGVKDSGAIIPGHGGILDRIDGLLAVVPVVALLIFMLKESAF